MLELPAHDRGKHETVPFRARTGSASTQLLHRLLDPARPSPHGVGLHTL